MLGKKLMRKNATLQDIYRLYQVVIRVPKIVAALQELECVTVNNVICDPMKDVLTVRIYSLKGFKAFNYVISSFLIGIGNV